MTPQKKKEKKETVQGEEIRRNQKMVWSKVKHNGFCSFLEAEKPAGTTGASTKITSVSKDIFGNSKGKYIICFVF